MAFSENATQRKLCGEGPRECGVRVETVGGRSKAWMKPRMLGEINELLILQAILRLFLITAMLIIFGQQRILWHEVVMFFMRLPREISCTLTTNGVESIINYLQ